MRGGVAAGARRRTVAVAAPANVIVNGDFAAADANWNGFWYSGKAVTGGTAVFTASPTYDDINQAITITAGKYYELTWTISARTSGTVFPQLTGGSALSGTIRSANGTFKERLLVPVGTNTFRFMMETSGTLSVDDISLVGPYDTSTVGGT